MIRIVDKLKKGLERSRRELGEFFDAALGRGILDENAATELEEALIQADTGPQTAEELVEDMRVWMKNAGGGVIAETLREALGLRISRILRSAEVPANSNQIPKITLIVGVNGTGKTTTAAKLAARFSADGEKIILGAADTFRAAAVEQLKIWGERLNIPVIAQAEGADPAAVAFDTVQAAINRDCDRAIIDTAGRLHNKTNLMAELEKVVRVIKKLREEVEILLVLDAAVGQNGLVQVKCFAESLPLSGLVVTKLDGTAKAGIIVRAVAELKKPVLYVGVGEGIDDLIPFDAKAFAKNLIS